jgi:hypothetical protein
MATATARPPAQVPNFKIVSRLGGVPAIHDSVAYAQTLVNSTQLTASLYQTALALATRSYDIATPVLVRTKPLLESADGLAVATFDRAEATFPYPFKTPTQDLVVVKQAKAVYDARLAPVLQSAQPVIQDVIHKTAQINSALGARAAATIHSSQELSYALLDQLKALAEQGKEIPGTLLDGVTKATTDIKTIVLSKDATLQEKSNKIGAYVVDQVKPVVDEIYNYVLGAKKKGQQAASKQADKVNGQ